MKIGDGYLLMIPGFVDDTPDKVILYEVQSMLELQSSDKMLAGHPSEDLPPIAWGSMDYPAHRVRRWVERHNRLVKVKLNAGGSLRLTYVEPQEWQKLITPEQWQWLVQVCQVSDLYRQEKEQAKVKVQPEPQPKVKRPKKPKVKAKIRRKTNRQQMVMEGE